ncbi:MAG: MFS transporter [Planctomycetes bacterium]|nr:MFS transporter [Planctomycetota bacterium]
MIYTGRVDGTLRELTPDEVGRLTRWRVSTFWVMLLGYVGYYLCRKNLSAAFPLMEKAFDYTNSDLGMIAAASEIAYAAGKFVNGPLGDKLGGKKIFLVGMAGAIFFNVLFALSWSLWMFVAVWCACRYFLSMGWGGIAKTIGYWYPAERNGTIMGFISINFQFGGVAAVLFAGFLVEMGSGWRGLFLWPAAVLSLVWVWSYLASKAKPTDVIPETNFGQAESGHGHKVDLENEEGEDSPSVKTILVGLLKLRIYRHLLWFSFLTTLLRSVFFHWTPKFLADIGQTDTMAILKSALFPFLGCLGTVALGWYTDRYPGKNGDRFRAMWVMLAGLTACLVGIAILATQDAKGYADVIVVLLGGAGFFLLGPYSMTSGCLSLDIAGSRGAGTCTGLLDGVGYLGGAVAAFGAGKISDSLGWHYVFGILAAFAFLSVASSFVMSWITRNAAPPAPAESPAS